MKSGGADAIRGPDHQHSGRSTDDHLAQQVTGLTRRHGLPVTVTATNAGALSASAAVAVTTTQPPPTG